MGIPVMMEAKFSCNRHNTASVINGRSVCGSFSNMWALVLYTDKILYICRIKDVSISGKRCDVKYSDQRKYSARVLAICNCQTTLENVKMYIDGAVKHVDRTWILAEAKAMTFAQASKKKLSSADDVLFMEKTLLPETRARAQIHSFLLKKTILKQFDFFAKSSYFVQLEKLNTDDMPSSSEESRNLKRKSTNINSITRETNNVNPSDSSEIDDHGLESAVKYPRIHQVRHPKLRKIQNDEQLYRMDPRDGDDTEECKKSGSKTMKLHQACEMKLRIDQNIEEIDKPQSRGDNGIKSSSKFSESSQKYSERKDQTLSSERKSLHDKSTLNTQQKIEMDVHLSSDAVRSSISKAELVKPHRASESKSSNDHNNSTRSKVTGTIFEEILTPRSGGIDTKEISSNQSERIKISPELPTFPVTGQEIFETDEKVEILDTTYIKWNHNDEEYLPNEDSLKQNTMTFQNEKEIINDELMLSTTSRRIKSEVDAMEHGQEMNLSDTNNNTYISSTLDGTIIEETILSPSEEKYANEPLAGLSKEKPPLIPQNKNNECVNEENKILDSTYSEVIVNEKVLTEEDLLMTNDLICPFSNSNILLLDEVLKNIDLEGDVKDYGVNIVGDEKLFPNDQSVESDIDSLKFNSNIPAKTSVMNQHQENDGDDDVDGEKGLFDTPISNKNSTSVQADGNEQLDKKQGPQIIGDEIINLSLYRKLLARNNQARGRKNFVSEDSDSSLNDSPIDSRNLDEPVSHSSMFEGTINNLQHSTEENLVEAEESDSSDDDEEYRPVNDESSSSAAEDGSTHNEEAEIEENTRTKAFKLFDSSLREDPHASAPDDRELVVDSSTAGPRKHFCLYCQKFQSKIARHLINMHSNEEDVKKFVTLPPKNKERQEIIACLRKAGDDKYNTERNFNQGKLLTCSRPNEKMQKTAQDFLICANCRGQYARTSLRHHWRKCTKQSGKNERIIVVKSKKIGARIHSRASVDTRKFVFARLREDEVVRGIRYDELVIIFANKQCQKYGTNPHQFEMIRQRLRRLGRFLRALKSIDNRVVNLADVYQPKFYDAAVEAVRIVAEFDPEKKLFKHPATASDLGTLLKQVGYVLRSEYIKTEKPELQKKVEDFLNLVSEDYGISINRVVCETRLQNDRRKVVILPSSDDVKKLYTLIVSERTRYFKQLTEAFSLDAWKNLAKTTLTYLLIFNRRRPGEMERLRLEDYFSRRGINEMADKEIYNKLSKDGKSLADKYVRVEIRGKLGRTVPVLIDNDIQKCLNLLIEHRDNALISSENPYVFALPSRYSRYLRACPLMREYSSRCGAAIPESLRGTKLRKHIATTCISLNLTNGQVTNFAKFMGHAEKIHKEIYCQPVLQTDIVNIAKLLQTAQGLDDNGDSGEIGPNTSVEANSPGPSTSRTSSARVPRVVHDQSSRISSFNGGTPKRWSAEECDAVLSAFMRYLDEERIPSGIEIQQLIDSTSCLRGRTVPQLRSWLHAQKKKKTK